MRNYAKPHNSSETSDLERFGLKMGSEVSNIKNKMMSEISEVYILE